MPIVLILWGCVLDDNVIGNLVNTTEVFLRDTNTLFTPTIIENTKNISTDTLIERTITPEKIPFYHNTCVNITNEEYLLSSGTLVLFDDMNQLIGYDINKKQKVIIGETKSVAVAVNPEKFAYVDKNDKLLKIVSNKLELINGIPTQGDWYGVVDWAKEEKLIIEGIQTRDDGSMLLPSLLSILDLQTREIRELSSGYPKMYLYSYGHPRWGKYSKYSMVLNSDLDRLVYLYDEPKGPRIVLWNLIENKEVSHLFIHDYFYNGGTPIWSFDGNEFIASVPIKYKSNSGEEFTNIDDELPYKGGNELILVTKNGEVNRMTYFTTNNEAEQYNKAWSPNGKLIAFWMRIKSGNGKWEIGLLDKETKEVTNLCVEGGDGSMPIYWSPDGNRIIISYIDDSHIQNAIIIDINNKKGYKLDIQDYILGWMEY